MEELIHNTKETEQIVEAPSELDMSALSRDNVAVVIPCYNEEQTVGHVIGGFRTALPEAAIYVIDNNSTDRTREEASAAGAHVISESRQGKGNAVRSIARRIEANVYVLVDGDLTYPPEAVLSLLQPVLCGKADMTVGDRISNNSYHTGAVRKFHGFGNWLVCAMVNRLFHTHLHDIMSGYRAMSRVFLKTLPVLSEGFEVETEMTLHALDKRLKIVEVPIDYRDRPQGSHSKLQTYSDGFLVLTTIASLFKNYKPLVFFTGLSLVSFTMGLFVGLRPILEYIESQYVSAIPSAVLSAALMILSMLFFCCGLILDTVVRHQRENYEIMLTQYIKLVNGRILPSERATNCSFS
jgi:glycosyltransferase involved in cell wall biosynthesis